MSNIIPKKPPISFERIISSEEVILTSEVPLRLEISKVPSYQKKKLLFISDKIRVNWDIFIILLAIYSCFYIPFSLCFSQSSNSSISMISLTTLIDLVFLFDIGLNFRTSYIDLRTSKEVTDYKKIAKEYIRSGRLVLDVLACTPTELIILLAGDEMQYLYLIDLIKMLRITRLNRIIAYMRIKVNIKIYLRLFKVLLYLMIYLHIVACSWYSLVSSSEEWTQNTDLMLGQPSRFYDSGLLHQYMFSLYAAIGMLVKFEVSPITKYEYLFCMTCVFTSALIITYFLGEITVLISSLERSKTEFYHSMNLVTRTMDNLKLPQQLQNNVIRHFISTNQSLIQHEEYEHFTKILPPSFLQKINLCLYKDLIISHPIFNQLTDSIKDVVRDLEYLFLVPDSFLIQAGDTPTFFSFISKGVLEVWVKGINHKDYLVREIHRGDYCGEIGLLYNVRRTASVRAIQYCSIGVLSDKSFHQMISSYETIEEEMKKRASIYCDPYQKEIIKIFRRIPYLHNLNSMALDYLIHSSEPLHLEKDSLLFEPGSVAEQVYFVIEGELDLCMSVYDTRLQKILHLKEIKSRVNRRHNTLLRSMKKMKKKFDTRKLAHLSLAILDRSSILCQIQALFRSHLETFCIALQPTKVLVLKTKTIEKLARTNSSLLLNIHKTKEKYMQFNHIFDEFMVIPPIIDCCKPFDIEIKEEAQSWKTIQKLKNAVLQIIVRNRHKLSASLISYKALVTKIKAIFLAEQKGYHKLVKLIETAELPPKAVLFAGILSVEEMKNPLFNQFADLYCKSEELSYNASSFNRETEDLVNHMLQKREHLDCLMREIQQIIEVSELYV